MRVANVLSRQNAHFNVAMFMTSDQVHNNTCKVTMVVSIFSA